MDMINIVFDFPSHRINSETLIKQWTKDKFMQLISSNIDVDAYVNLNTKNALISLLCYHLMRH